MRAALLCISLVGCLAPFDPVTKTDIADLIDRVDALEAENAGLRSALDARADVEALAALERRVSDAEATLDALAGDDVYRFISDDVELMVPAEYRSLQAAFDSLQQASIARWATVTIQLDAGTYNLDGPVFPSHRDGARIHVRGNPAAPETVVLVATRGRGAVHLEHGAALGMLDGVTLQGSGTGESDGILVTRGSSLVCADVLVSGFGGAGVHADEGGVIYCDRLDSYDNGWAGVAATRGGVVRVPAASAERNEGPGFTAIGASVVEARGARATFNAGGGFVAERAAWVDGSDGMSESNSGAGFAAYVVAAVDAYGSDAVRNGGAGLDATDASAVIGGNGGLLRFNRMGVNAQRSSTVSAWDGLSVRENTDDGISVGGSSSASFVDAEVVSNGATGLNAYWGSWIGVFGTTTLLYNKYATNRAITDDSTEASSIYE